MRYFLKISYDGSPFHGWQTQPNASSVQQTIEEALSRILRRPTPIVGAGRTDAGVNAKTMYAHFDYPNVLNHMILSGLNSLVGPSIAITDIIPVADDLHARFDATARTYHYYVHEGKNPFLSAYSLQVKQLDYAKMNNAARMLLSTDDFTSFAKLHSDAKTNICRVSEARWDDIGDGRHVFVITADRFLRNMVRAVVGTLVEVGRGKMTLEEFEEVINRRDRCSAGTSMPPHPLFLWDVKYDSLDNEEENNGQYKPL